MPLPLRWSHCKATPLHCLLNSRLISCKLESDYSVARADVWNYLVPGRYSYLGTWGIWVPRSGRVKPGSALPRAPPQNALLRGNSPNRGKCGWRESHSLIPCLLRAYNRLGANFYQTTARLTQHQSMVKRAPFDVQALQHSRFRNIGPWALATTITDSPPPPPTTTHYSQVP